MKIDNLLNRAAEVKMLEHQQMVDRLNGRHNEQIPLPLIALGCVVAVVLLLTRAMG